MPTLLDIGPVTETVEIGGVQLKVRGLTAADLFGLFSEFPDMKTVVEPGEGIAALVKTAPDLIAKIIAIATGDPGNKTVEEKAKTLGATDQMTILTAVQRLSFPKGFGPFVDQLNKLMGMELTAAIPALSSSTPSGSAGNGSPAGSSAALQTDSPRLARGNSPRVS